MTRGQKTLLIRRETMGGELLFGTVGLMILGCLIGLVVAFGIKLIGKRARLPGWPMLLFAVLGGVLPAALSVASRLKS